VGGEDIRLQKKMLTAAEVAEECGPKIKSAPPCVIKTQTSLQPSNMTAVGKEVQKRLKTHRKKNLPQGPQMLHTGPKSYKRGHGQGHQHLILKGTKLFHLSNLI